MYNSYAASFRKVAGKEALAHKMKCRSASFSKLGGKVAEVLFETKVKVQSLHH
jgi:hypothetical protein